MQGRICPERRVAPRHSQRTTAEDLPNSQQNLDRCAGGHRRLILTSSRQISVSAELAWISDHRDAADSHCPTLLFQTCEILGHQATKRLIIAEAVWNTTRSLAAFGALDRHSDQDVGLPVLEGLSGSSGVCGIRSTGALVDSFHVKLVCDI